jgi:hypothetical protein
MINGYYLSHVLRFMSYGKYDTIVRTGEQNDRDKKV